ncbi:PAS domain-containing protein [Haloarcula brevis]|uniref:PAS domain-containing protein n=1 Tax=Haloarcula brevis TaxID=3111453 RepID=UPI00300F2712
MADHIRVLHVDDAQGFAEMTAEYLERVADDLTVVTATSPDDGLARLDDSIDCVVSDYEMPERNGLELFDAVRDRYPDLPFILFTGKGNEAVASEAITAGVTDYLQKDRGTDQYTILANRVRNAVDRRRARLERERSERRFEAVFEDPQTLVGVLNPDGTVRKANQTALEAVDAPREAVVGEPFWELSWWPEGHSAEVEEWVERAADGEYVEVDIDHTTAGPAQFSYHGYIRPVRDDDGDIVSLVASGHEVTGKRERAEKLERKTDLLRHAQQIADVGGWELDIAEPPYEATWTDQLFEIFGIPPQDAMTPDEVLSFVHPDDHDRVAAETEQLIEAGEGLTQEYRIVTGEGNERWLRVISERPDDRADVIRGATLDVTEQKQTTQALRERERTLSQYKEFTDDIFDAVDDVFFLLDERGRVRRWNESLERVTGYDGDDLSSMDGVAFFRPEDRETVREACRAGDTTTELPLVAHDGEPVPYEFVFDRVETPEGERRTAAIGRDISARKEREEALARTNRQLQTILETTTALVFLKDSDGRYQRINERFRAVLIDGPMDVVGKTDAELFPDEIAERIRADDRQVIETGESIEREEEIPTPHGPRTFLTLKNPIYDAEGAVAGICGVATDITERAEYKANVERQKERLDEFASIVSHDLRNPLDVARGRLRLAESDPSAEHLAAIERSLDRMQELIDDLLALARQGEAVTDVRPVTVENAVEQAWRSVRTGAATLETDIEGTVMADPTRLQQLFENLIRNSVEHGSTSSRPAADDDVERGSTAPPPEPGNGDVTPDSDGSVASGGPRADARGITVTVGALDDGTGFYVEDDGAGIPDDERGKVFRSGYSTSESGTGFGLAIVREIAEAHGWEITVTESASGGARFEFRGVDGPD